MPEVDERVASLVFDNSEFDPEIKKSQKTLEEFEKSLDPKAFEKYAKNLNSEDFKPLSNSLTALGNTFKSLETIAAGALLNIGMKLENTLSSAVRKMTIDPMIQGWTAYGEKVTSVQTIMAATRNQFVEFADAVDRGDESVQNFIQSQDALITGSEILKNQMSYVNAQLDQLMAFTDETSASYGVMVNNIGKFTSQNIDLQTSVKAMEGIATWANLSGANAEQMSRAMYNISQSLGVGKMLTRDWMSIENANMATVEFKQSAIDAAVELGILTKGADGLARTADGSIVSVSNFRDTLSKDWFTSDVMMSALDRYGRFSQEIIKASQESEVTVRNLMDAVDDISEAEDQTKAIDEFVSSLELEDEVAKSLTESLQKLSSEEYDLGKRAFRATYESKTLADAVGYVGDAIRTGWIKSYEYIVGDYEEARKFWTEVAEVLYTLFVEAGEVRNQVLALWKAGGGRNDLIEALKNIRDLFLDEKTGIFAIFKELLGEFFPQLKSEESTVQFFAKVLLSITKTFRNFSENLRKNPEVLEKIKRILRTVVRVLKFTWELLKGIVTFFAPTIRWTKELFRTLSNLISPLSEGAEGAMDFIEGLNGIKMAFLLLGAAVALPIKLLQNFIDWLNRIGNMTLPELGEAISTWWNNVWNSITGFVTKMWTLGSNIVTGFSQGFEKGWKAVEEMIGGLFNGLIDIVKNILGIHSPSTVFIAIGAMLLGGLIVGLSTMEGPLAETFKNILGIINSFAMSIASIATKILIGIAVFKLVKGISKLFNMVPNLFESLGNMFSGFGKAAKIWAKNKYKPDTIRAIGQSALMIAGALTMIAAAIITIKQLGITWDDVKPILLMIGVIALGFIGIISALALIQKKMNTASEFMEATFGGKIAQKLGIDAKKASITGNGMANGMKVLSKAMLNIAVSFSVLLGSFVAVLSVMKHNEVTMGDMWAMLGMFAAVTVFMSGLAVGMQALNKAFGKENFLASQMESFSKFVKAMTKNLRTFAYSIGIIAGISILLEHLSSTYGGFKIGGAWKTNVKDLMMFFFEFVTLFAGFISVFGVIEKHVANINKATNVFTKFVGTITALFASFAGIVYLIQSANITNDTLNNLYTIEGAIFLLAGVFSALAMSINAVGLSTADIASFSALAGTMAGSVLAMVMALKILSEAKVSAIDVGFLSAIAATFGILVVAISIIAAAFDHIKISWGVIAKVAAIIGMVVGSIIVLAASFYIVGEALGVFAENFKEFSRVLSIWHAIENKVDLLWDFIGICSALFLASLFLGLAAPGFLVFCGVIATFAGAMILLGKAGEKFASSIKEIAASTTIAAATFNAGYPVFEKAFENMKKLFTSDMREPIELATKLGVALISIGVGGYVASGAIYMLTGAIATMNLALDAFKNVMDYLKTITSENLDGMMNFAVGIGAIGLAVTLTAPGVMTLALATLFFATAALIAGNNIEAVNNIITTLLNRATDCATIMTTFAGALAAVGIGGIFLGVGLAAIGVGLAVIAIATLALVVNGLIAVGVLALFNSVCNSIKEDNPELYNAIMSIVTAFSNLITKLEKLFEYLGPLFKNIVTDSVDIAKIINKILVTLIKKLFKNASDAYTSFQSWWDTYIDPIVKWFENLSKKILDYFGFNSWEEAGKNALKGLAKGLSNMPIIGDITKGLYSLANGLIDAYNGKKGQDAHSPAKKWEPSGEYAIEGIGVGQKNAAKDLMKEDEKLAAEMSEDFYKFYAEQNVKNAEKYKDKHYTLTDKTLLNYDGDIDFSELDKDTQKALKIGDAYLREHDIFEKQLAKNQEEMADYQIKQQDKTLSGALENIWEDIKNIFKQVKEGNMSLGDGFKELLESLKTHGGTFLGEKLDGLKNLLFGEGGPLAGLADLLKNPLGSFEGIFKDLDLEKIIKDAENAINNLDLSKIVGNVPDMSGLGGTVAGAAAGRQDQYIFTQNNYSPKALSRLEIYRQTKRQFNEFRVREELAK